MFGLRNRTLNVLNVIVGVLAIVIAILTSRSVSTKELTITYFGKRELVTLVRPGSVDLEVLLNGTRVQSPWLLSARLENTGSQPVELGDIEEPVRLTFSSGKVLGARIVQRSPEQLYGKTVLSGNSVVIEHRLLNRGAWLAFDIIFDGEPESNPEAFASISGVELKEVPLQSDTQKTFLTIVPLPLPLVWLLLVICTVAVVISVVVGIVLIAKEMARMGIAARARAERALAAEAASASAPPDELSSTPRNPAGDAANQILQALGGRIDTKFIDDPALLRVRISQKNLDPLLASLGVDAERAAVMLATALKQSFRDEMGEKLSKHMVPDLSRRIRRAIRAIDVRDISTRELSERVRAVVAQVSDSLPVTPPADRDGMMFGFLFLVIGVFLLLLLGGTWRTVFS